MVSEGKVTGFQRHPSGDYLLVTSSKGRLYVFRIDTGELRGTIKIPMNASDCLIDPSGLYVVVKVPPYASINTVNFGDEIPTLLGNYGANERNLTRNTVMMYEIGTGLPAAEICSVFDITQMQFSPDGRFLSLGSSTGAVSVWSMSNTLYQNVSQVMEAMKISSDFWFNYPIFLPDYELYYKPEEPNPIVEAMESGFPDVTNQTYHYP